MNREGAQEPRLEYSFDEQMETSRDVPGAIAFFLLKVANATPAGVVDGLVSAELQAASIALLEECQDSMPEAAGEPSILKTFLRGGLAGVQEAHPGVSVEQVQREFNEASNVVQALRDTIGAQDLQNRLGNRLLRQGNEHALRQTVRRTPPEGWVSAYKLLEQLPIDEVMDLTAALEQYPRSPHEEAPLVEVDGQEIYYVSPAAAVWLRRGGALEQAGDKYVSPTQAIKRLNIGAALLNTLVSLLDIEHVDKRAGPRNLVSSCISEEDVLRIEDYLNQNYKLLDPKKDVPVADISEALGYKSSFSPKRSTPYLRRAAHRPEWVTSLDPFEARKIMDEHGRKMPYDAVRLDDLPEAINLPSRERANFEHLLTASPFRWRVVTRKIFSPENGEAWLTKDDAEAFGAWVHGDRHEKSTMGWLERLVRLNQTEFKAADRALFDLREPRTVPAGIAAQVINSIFHTGALRLDPLEREVIGSLFQRNEPVVDVVVRELLLKGKIPPLAKPLVTNQPRYLAQHLDSFLVNALKKLGSE